MGVGFRLFKECPHPDEKQRLELSKRLCLETRQVKFWFQNRRTQMKVAMIDSVKTRSFQSNWKKDLISSLWGGIFLIVAPTRHSWSDMRIRCSGKRTTSSGLRTCLSGTP